MTETDTSGWLTELMKQLELDLAPPEGLAPSPTAWRYRFTAQGLVEELDGQRYVYGDWNRFFGCWEVNPETRASKELVPHWPVFSENGVWLSPESISCGGKGRWRGPKPSRWRYEANLAFAAHFSAIPARMRRLVAGLGPYQWVALDLIWQVPGFAKYLDEQLHQGDLHYVCACLATGGVASRSRAGRRVLARRMMRGRRREFLSRVSGYSCSKSTLRALARLEDGAHGWDIYECLLDAMARPDTAKILSHMPTITVEALAAVHTLPGIALIPNVMALCANAEEGEECIFVIERMFDGLPFRLWPRAAQSLRHARTPRDVLAWRVKWKQHLARLDPLPPPPFSGNDRLKPLATVQAMCREALEMRNCLHMLDDDVMAGETYFYHWSGSEPATVKLVRDPEIGWRLEEALCAYNGEPRDDTLREIVAAVGAQLKKQQAGQGLPGRLCGAKV